MSIKQKARPAGRSRYPASLPDFRNLGVVLRTVVLVNALGLAAVLVRNDQIEALFGELLDMAVRVEFPLILCVAALFLVGTAGNSRGHCDRVDRRAVFFVGLAPFQESRILVVC